MSRILSPLILFVAAFPLSQEQMQCHKTSASSVHLPEDFQGDSEFASPITQQNLLSIPSSAPCSPPVSLSYQFVSGFTMFYFGTKRHIFTGFWASLLLVRLLKKAQSSFLPSMLNNTPLSLCQPYLGRINKGFPLNFGENSSTSSHILTMILGECQEEHMNLLCPYVSHPKVIIKSELRIWKNWGCQLASIFLCSASYQDDAFWILSRVRQWFISENWGEEGECRK